MSGAARVIDWNGRDLPPELANLPPGRYRLEPVAKLPPELEFQPGDEIPTDATTPEVTAWLRGEGPCPWPR
jgi:hypothetical protein